MNVLLIEPDKILANNYQQAFAEMSFKVDCFTDPQLAVEHMDGSLPDSIVMEIQLAPLSGVAFLHELRGYEDFASVPIVIYSSIPKESFKIDAKGWAALGVVKYFYKPRISAQKVASFVKGYLT